MTAARAPRPSRGLVETVLRARAAAAARAPRPTPSRRSSAGWPRAPAARTAIGARARAAAGAASAAASRSSRCAPPAAVSYYGDPRRRRRRSAMRRERADVCVIGTGAGGAPVARALAEAGADVVVLEEGGAHRRRRA